MTGNKGFFLEEWSQTQSVLTLRRLATSSAVRRGSTSATRLGGFRRCCGDCWPSLDARVAICSALSKEGTISDVLSIWHLALSISFQREVSINLSPTLLIDFASVFAYAALIPREKMTVTSKRPATSRSLIDSLDSLLNHMNGYRFSTINCLSGLWDR